MTTYEEPFIHTYKGNGLLPPVPIELAYSDSQTVTVTPGTTTTFGVLNSIAVYDIFRRIQYTWLKNSTYPTGYWVNGNNMLSTGYTGAAAGATPTITPGTNSLAIAVGVTNEGTVTGTITIALTDTTGAISGSQTTPALAAGGTVAVMFQGSMTATADAVTITVTP